MNNVKYYWVNNKETNINEICLEVTKPNGIVYYKLFDDEYMYLLNELEEYYTFICSIDNPRKV